MVMITEQAMREYLSKCFTRACMYLTKGYLDGTEKDDYTVMDWEEFISNEVLNDCEEYVAICGERNDCKGIPITSEED